MPCNLVVFFFFFSAQSYRNFIWTLWSEVFKQLHYLKAEMGCLVEHLPLELTACCGWTYRSCSLFQVPNIFYIEVTLTLQTTVMHALKMVAVLFRENKERNHIFLNLPLTSVIKVLISLHGSLQYELMQCFEYLNLRDQDRPKWFS